VIPNYWGESFLKEIFQLDLTTAFYQGEEKSEEELGDLIRNANAINLVGQKTISIAIKEGIIEEQNIIRVQNIPHAQGAIVQD